MDTKAFYYFQAVYEESNIHTAARKLHISPQGLGKNIKMLESELNAELFIRTKSGVIPTETGKYFYEKSCQLIREIQNMKKEIEWMNRSKNELQIGFSAGTLKAVSMRHIFSFIDLHPAFDITWGENENEKVVKGICEGTLDYGFITSRIEQNDIVQLTAVRCPIVVLVYEGHPFQNLDEIELSMLEGEDLVMMNEQYRIYYDFMRICQMHDVHPRIRAKTMDGEALYRLCEQRAGLAVCPAFPEIQHEKLKSVSFKTPYYWNIYGTWKKEAEKNPAVKEFKAYCEHNLRFDK